MCDLAPDDGAGKKPFRDNDAWEKNRDKKGDSNDPKELLRRYKVFDRLNIEPAQSDYHAPPRATTNRCKGR